MSSFLDKTGLAYFWNKIQSKFVQKEYGKGLSSEDYTYSEKVKLQNIENYANNYTLPTASSSTLGGVKIGDNVKISSGFLTSYTGRIYKATFWVDNWYYSNGYRQTVMLERINGAPIADSNCYLYPIIGIDSTLDETAKKELRKAVRTIQIAKKTLGYNSITVESSTKPEVDAEVYFVIEKGS